MIWKLAYHHLNARPIPTQVRLKRQNHPREVYLDPLTTHFKKAAPNTPNYPNRRNLNWTEPEQTELEKNEMVLLKHVHEEELKCWQVVRNGDVGQAQLLQSSVSCPCSSELHSWREK